MWSGKRARSRNRSRRNILIGAQVGAGARMLPWIMSRDRCRATFSRQGFGAVSTGAGPFFPELKRESEPFGYFTWSWSRSGGRPGPEQFVNLQGLLVQSSKMFGISSVQFGSLVTSLSGKLVQFSQGHGSQLPPFSSVHSFHFTNSSGPESD